MSPLTPVDHLSAARLHQRAFVVLGAGGGGLGDATCAALAGAGAELLCVDRDPDRARAVAGAVGGHAFAADVTRRDGIEAIFADAVERFGERFSGVVDIVGVAKNGRICEWGDAEVEWQFDIVLKHAVLATQVAGPLLARNGRGSLTFVGSLAGLAAFPGQAFYGMAKAALLQLVRSAAIEFGPAGVRVNAVIPGFTATPRLLQLVPGAMWKRLAATNPLRRVATSDDIAKAILFLASDLAGYVTGNILTLDGGVSHVLALPEPPTD